MTDRIIDTIVNLTDVVENIIESRINTVTTSLNNYVLKTDVQNEIDSDDSEKPITGQSVTKYIEEELEDYVQTSTLSNYVQESTLERCYVQKTMLDDYVLQETFDQGIGENLTGHSFKYPAETETSINKLINAGYYQYVGELSTFYCAPDTIPYLNAIIRVEKQNNHNHIIQHVYATSPDANNVYKIDGREFVRHGYLTINSNDEIVTNWDDWKVSYLPWKQRNDLLTLKGENVDNDSFHIYECTAGYVFQWTQKSADHRYTLVKNQYTYGTIYEFRDLPIPEPTIFSNFIGHIDLKITHNKVEIRSSNNRGEYVVGIDGNYFVPRTN